VSVRVEEARRPYRWPSTLPLRMGPRCLRAVCGRVPFGHVRERAARTCGVSTAAGTPGWMGQAVSILATVTQTTQLEHFVALSVVTAAQLWWNLWTTQRQDMCRSCGRAFSTYPGLRQYQRSMHTAAFPEERLKAGESKKCPLERRGSNPPCKGGDSSVEGR